MSAQNTLEAKTRLLCYLCDGDIGMLTFIRLCPGKVIANHMDALNHCPVGRKQLTQRLKEHHLSAKVMRPLDGQSLELNV